MNQKPKVLAVDFGRGGTKFHYEGVEGAFPSVVGRIVETKGIVHDNGVVHVKRGRYTVDAMVGQEAVWSSDSAIQAMAHMRTARDAVALVAEAMWLAGVEGEVVLVCGAPEETYVVAKADYQTWLKGTWKVNGRTIDVKQVLVLPEPSGTVAAQGMTPDGTVVDDAILGQNIAVLDIGQHSTDATVFYTSGNGKGAVRAENDSFGLPFGVHRVQEDLQTWLMEKHKRTVPIYRLFRPVETATLTLDDQPLDLKPVIQKSVKTFAEYLIHMLEEKWQLIDIDHYLLTGGGAALFHAELKSWRTTLRVVDDPVMANVRGFSAVGHRYLEVKQ